MHCKPVFGFLGVPSHEIHRGTKSQQSRLLLDALTFLLTKTVINRMRGDEVKRGEWDRRILKAGFEPKTPARAQNREFTD